MPTALGGKGGGVTTDEENILWVKNRLENFPTLPDLSSPVSASTRSGSGTLNTKSPILQNRSVIPDSKFSYSYNAEVILLKEM